MKKLGMVRKLDELGRITLPMELRRTIGLKERDEIDIAIEGNSIILKPYAVTCVCCGEEKDNLKQHKDAYLCADCLAEFSKA